MARIRSIHPGIWTDEAFVTLSPMARLLFMGIWNECDDGGSFEWSPLKLKMRILPADNVDAAELMTELLSAAAVMQYEIDGKRFGAVRNFCQYQRPKKPNSTYPQTDEVRKWVNTEARSTRDGSEAVGKQLPTKPEKRRQMEDGGGSGSSVSNETGPKPDNSDSEFWSSAKAFLRPETGDPGKMVGKWCKAYPRVAVASAITSAQVERPAQRIPYIEAILRKQGSPEPVVPL